MIVKKRATGYVVFVGSEADHFWRPLLPRGWRHCYVLLPFWYPNKSALSYQWTVKLEATGWGLDYDVLYARPSVVARVALEEGATAAVRFQFCTPPRRLRMFRGLFSCVSLVKAVLGIAAWWVITPRRLHDWLLATGGEEVPKNEQSR